MGETTKPLPTSPDKWVESWKTATKIDEGNREAETGLIKSNEEMKKEQEQLKQREKQDNKSTSPAPEKPSWKFEPVWVTSGGDSIQSGTATGLTAISPDGTTRITGGLYTSSERPDPNMREINTTGVGVVVNTTPGALGNGFKKIGQGIKKLFTRKK